MEQLEITLMNLTIKLMMLNEKINNYMRYEKNSPNYEKHLGELILQRQNLQKSLEDKHDK